MKAVFCIAVLVFGILVAPFNTFAEMQILPTDKGTVKVGISTIPEKPAPGTIKLKIDFLNPQTGAIQEHIDYVITITKDGKAAFGPIPLTHTSIGTVTVPVELKEKGEYKITVDVEGVLFIPTSEKATFSMTVGQAGTASSAQPSAKPPTKSPDAKMPDSGKSASSGSTGKVTIKADQVTKADTKTTKTDTKTTKTDTKTNSTAKNASTAAKKTDSKPVKKTAPKQNTKQ